MRTPTRRHDRPTHNGWSPPGELTLPDAEIVDVTPQLAETRLRRDPNNRNLRRAVVEGYARDMAAGRWRLNGESVKFSADGKLLDGQHRLTALVQAQITTPIVVVRGLTADVMPTVDAGAKRTYSDALKLTGEENTATLAAVCQRAVMWEWGMRTNTGAIRPTALEIDDWLGRNPDIRGSAEIAKPPRLPRATARVGHRPVPLAVQRDRQRGRRLALLRVADGDGLASTDPIAVLRNRITRLRLSGGRINETEGLALTIRA